MSALASPTSPTWVLDMDTTKCMACLETIFSTLVRRHHCRHCGRVVCGSCSKARVYHHEENDSVRTCIDCVRCSFWTRFACTRMLSDPTPVLA
jgi:zinc finger FYVE domain-containing protein 26